MSFCYINVETNFFFFQIWKNLQVQLMSFYYINVETIEKRKNIFFFQIWKNAQVFSNEKMLKSI